MGVISSRSESIAGWCFIFTCAQILLKTIHPFYITKSGHGGDHETRTRLQAMKVM